MVLQQQEYKQLKTSEEERFLSSIGTQKIKDATLEDIKQPLRYAMVKVGLRAQNFPTEEEKGILLAHVVQEFGANTLDEIRLAFDLLISEQLDLEDKERICYENFSCAYLSLVMNSYRRWANNVYEQHSPKYNPLQIEHKEDTSDKAMQEWFDSVKQNETRFEFLPPMLYDWLEEKGKIKKSNKEKWDYMRAAVNVRQAQLAKTFADDPKSLPKLQAFNDMKERMSFAPDEMGKLKDISKRLILKEYIDESN